MGAHEEPGQGGDLPSLDDAPDDEKRPRRDRNPSNDLGTAGRQKMTTPSVTSTANRRPISDAFQVKSADADGAEARTMVNTVRVPAKMRTLFSYWT